jgi:hypothetical protein
LHGPRIERQSALEQTDRLRIIFSRRRLPVTERLSPENIVQSIGMFGPPGGVRADQLEVECDRNPAGDMVLQCE